MKITIDTQHDSHENIKKAIKMLQSVVGGDVYTNDPDIFTEPKESATTTETEKTETPYVNIFGDDPDPEPSPEPQPPEDPTEPIPDPIPPEDPTEPPTESAPVNAFTNIFGDTSSTPESTDETPSAESLTTPPEEETTTETEEEPEEEKEDKFSGEMMEFY